MKVIFKRKTLQKGYDRPKYWQIVIVENRMIVEERQNQRSSGGNQGEYMKKNIKEDRGTGERAPPVTRGTDGKEKKIYI